MYTYHVHHPHPPFTGEEHRRIPLPLIDRLDPFFVPTFDIFLIFIPIFITRLHLVVFTSLACVYG